MSYVKAGHGNDPGVPELVLSEEGNEHHASANKSAGATRLIKFLAKIAGKDVGDLTPKTKMEQALNDIAENGGGVPTPTIEDEGKVLTVDSSGDPAWAQPSGGGGSLCVTITAVGGPSVYETDKTAAEVLAAVQAGMYVYGRHRGGSGWLIYQLTEVLLDGDTPNGYVMSFAEGTLATTVEVFEEGGNTTVTVTNFALATK